MYYDFFAKKFQKTFGSLEKVCTFAIPKHREDGKRSRSERGIKFFETMRPEVAFMEGSEGILK